MQLQRMELGEPDESGRRRPQPVESEISDVPVEVAIIAIGNAPNPMLSKTPGLAVSRRGTIEVDPATGASHKQGVFAGGDIVTGGATVILAMGAGRRAAAAIHDYITRESRLRYPFHGHQA
jgi:glutamate synthase (NADPH/NADH) small chain